MMSTAIAIFVKTPSLSPLKTRLAAGIGATAAQEFYLLSLIAVQATVKDVNVTPYWAVAEERGLNDPLWKNFPGLHTGEGNLGQRQYHIYETLLKKYDRVLLIGADSPQLSKKLFEQAMSALDKNDYVIGPTQDGGYYLFGGRVSTLAKVWENVPWSTSTTRKRLEVGLTSKPIHLPLLTDVDTATDLYCVEAEMPDVLNKQQKQLIEWINKIEPATTL